MIKKLKETAFFDCQQLKMIKIPSFVEVMGKHCFQESSIERLEFQDGSTLKIIKDVHFTIVNI